LPALAVLTAASSSSSGAKRWRRCAAIALPNCVLQLPVCWSCLWVVQLPVCDCLVYVCA
jgi:hypothetical protein